MITVGDLLTVLRFRDEATPLANRAFSNMQNMATQTAQAVARVLTPAMNSATQATNAFTPAVAGAAGALGGGGGAGGGGGGRGGGGGGLGGAAHSAAYSLTLLGRGAREAGQFLTYGLTAPITAAGTAAFKFGKDFEAITQRTVTLAGVLPEEIKEVRTSLLALASDAGVGPGELAEAMYAASSTTRDTATAMDIVTRAAKLSAAGLGDTGVVARTLTTIINSYGKENISASHASDVLVRAIRDGGAEAKDLAPVLANVVPFAAKLGVSFEELSANIATITQVGVPASEAVTQITSVFASMTRETKRGTEALATIGMTYADLREMLAGPAGLSGVIQLLSDKFGLQDGRLFDVLGRLEALKNVLGLTGAQAGTYVYEVNRMNDALGEADQAFEGITDTVEHQWNKALADMQVLSIEAFNEMKPAIMDFFDYVRDTVVPTIKEWINWYRDLDSTQKSLVNYTVVGLALLGPVLNSFGVAIMGVGNLIRGIGALASYWGVTWAGIGAALTPLLAPLAAITGAILAIWLAMKAGEKDGVKDRLATWLLSTEWWENPLAAIARLTLGIDKLSEADARLAVAAQRAAEEQAKLSGEAEATFSTLKNKHPKGWMPDPFSVDMNPAARGGFVQGTTMSQLLSGSGASGGSGGGGKGQGDWKKELEEAKKGFAGLTEAQKETIRTGMELGKSMKEMVDKLNLPESTIKSYQNYVKEQEKFAESVNYATWNALPPFKKGLTDTSDELERAAAGVDEYGNQIAFTFREIYDANKESREESEANWRAWQEFNGGFKQGMQDSGDAALIAADKLEAHAKALKSLKDGLGNVVSDLRKLKQVSGEGDFGNYIEGLAEVLASLNLVVSATDEMKKGWDQLQAEDGNVAAGLMQIAQGALAASAAFLQATGSGSTFQRTMGGITSGAQLGSSIGGMFGPVGAGVGAVIGAVGGGIIGFLRGSSAAQKEAAERAKKLAEEMAKVKQQVAEAGEAFKKTHPLVKDLSAAAAALGVALNFDVTTAAGLEEFNAQLALLDERLSEVDGELAGLLGEAEELGMGLPAHIQEAIIQMADLGLITQDTLDLFNRLGGDGEVSWKKMKEAADRYKDKDGNPLLSEHSMGAAYKQGKINSQAQQLIDDFDTLTRGGAEADAVIAAMGDTINKVVNESIAFGTTIPENMRPWIQKMIDSKKLVDENGNLITDMSQIKFGPPIESQFDKLIAKLDEFISKLKELPGLFDASSRAGGNVDPGYDYGNGGGGSGDGSGGGGERSVNFNANYTPGKTTQQTRVQVMMDRRTLVDAVIEGQSGRLALKGAK